MSKPQIRPTLEVWMKSAGMSDTQLASLSGYSVETIRRAKSGKRISQAAAVAICSALGITLNDIEGLNY